ncbi:nucleoside-diphosphate sugar epimerase/dehydratase [Granulicoccus sp. GXG6511]|uniref:polysaccharide biosynthesis protein n=1 Tax=Granulicoccus sp. GXG6511 TaxID=3381351 RepID=UPI003D7D92D8
MSKVPVFWKRAIMLGWDLLAWVLAFAGFVLVRYDFHLKDDQWAAALAFVGALMMAQVVLGFVTKHYLGRSRVGSFAEVTALGVGVLGISAVLGIAFMVLVPRFPNGIALVMPPIALLLMAAGRWVFRGYFGPSRRRAASKDAVPVLVYGAGEAGTEVARLVSTTPNAPYQIVGYLDDARHKKHLRLHTYRVLGTGADLTRLIRETGAEQVILAMGHPEPDLLQRVSESAAAGGAKLVVIPPVRERIGGRVSLDQLREFDVVDLLGRRQIETDLTQVADLVTNKVVLITGAGGSIGAELSRQVHALGPTKLFLLDRDESELHALQLSIHGNGLLDDDQTVLCDIRDHAALQRVFSDCQPDVVLHAAALKHLPMLERFPVEGWKTNVLGTLNVLRCAHRAGVRRFVNVSTDKAADASSVLGQTKRLAERVTAWYAMKYDLEYVSVRFGNVLGSRGSVVHAFKAQIARGGPVTVTHPEVTRFFMTIPEACELVLQAGAIGKPGDVLVLDMGEPVKIMDVARRLIDVSGRDDVEIVISGLRSGEKMHEVLLGEAESGQPSEHPLITQVTVPVINPIEVIFDETDEARVGQVLADQVVAVSPNAVLPGLESGESLQTGSQRDSRQRA